MHFYAWHAGDYVNHTRHLTLMEDLAYRRMLDLYYRDEQPLSVDPAAVARQIGMPDNVNVVASVLREFFQKGRSGHRNKRADEEITKYRAKLATASKAGKASAASRLPKSTVVERSLNGRATVVQPTMNHEPETKNMDACMHSVHDLTKKLGEEKRP